VSAPATHIAAASPLSLVKSTADLDRAETAIKELFDALGVDLSAPDGANTPRRVPAMYHELLTPRPFNPTTSPNDAGYDELVLAKDIPFTSLCAHHALPFSGVVHVGYLPGERILGLSKLARGGALLLATLQVQERLTKQVADWLQEELRPRGAGVLIDAEHLCMTVRGVQAAGTRTLTSTMYGLLRERDATRQEFLTLIRAQSGTQI
jgi:GTP cyclohydrolase IA